MADGGRGETKVGRDWCETCENDGKCSSFSAKSTLGQITAAIICVSINKTNDQAMMPTQHPLTSVPVVLVPAAALRFAKSM